MASAHTQLWIEGGPRASSAVWSPIVAGLCVGSLFAWWFCPNPVRGSLSLPEVLYVAFGFSGLTWLLGSAVALLTCVIRLRPWNESFALSKRTGIAAAWFAPFWFYWHERSVWFFAVCVLLTITVVGLIRSQRKLTKITRNMALTFVVALLLQTAAVVGFTRYRMAAAVLIMTAAAAVTWWWLEVAAKRKDKRWPTVLPVILTLSLTAAGLARYMPTRRGLGGGYGDADQGMDAKKSTDRSGDSAGVVVGDTYRGVILWPEVKKHVTLVPPLPILKPDLFSGKASDPLSVPFYGVYWYFKAPDREPPKNSYETHGNPSKQTFRSTDFRAMEMVARQNFATLINTSCCREIRLGVSNGDFFPGTVELELILANTSQPKIPRLSLGRVPVRSAWVGDAPIPEILAFTVPRSATLRQFDEATIVFHASRYRRQRSARVAVERFIFVPRGRV